MISIPITTTSPIPMYEQIYNYIKEEILNGTLGAGERLPSTRSLAAYLLVSRNTVDMAYGQLLSEGYIDSKQKSGYFVNEIVSLKSISLPKEDAIDYSEQSCAETYSCDFSPFTVDTSHFPFTTWKRLTNSCLADNDNFFHIPNSQGDYAFRKAIAAYLHQSRGVTTTPEQIIIGAGADYLLQLLSNLFDPTDCIAMEDPGYLQAKRIFASLQRKTVSLPVTKQGMNLSSLASSDANIVYVTPSHQYPLGTVMPINQRLTLLSWANEDETRYIIEDDHDSEFRYVGKPIPSLQSIDTGEKVIYMGTFSKAISPAIRIAYMVLPKPLLQQYRTRFSFLSSTVSRLDQNIMTAFMAGGYFERHLNRMRKQYKAKHDCMLSSLKCFGRHISIYGCNAGLHLVVTFHIDKPESSLITLAKQTGILLYPLSPHYETLPENYEPSFMFGYANLSEEQIEDSISQLFRVFQPLFS